MANLIITVIAIALVAIASLMGAYYGGAAFMNNQSLADASSVLNQTEQVAGAWSSYLGDNLDVPPNSLNLLIAGKYLQDIPIAPRAPGNIQSFPIFAASATGHYYAYADVGTPSSVALAGLPADPYATGCFRIQKTAKGQAPASIATVAQGAIAAQGNGTFGCAILSAALTNGVGGATPPAGDLSAGDYILEYLLQ